MTDPNHSPPPAAPLALPSAAAASALNAPAPLPHPDLEDFLRNDRHRAAQELWPVVCEGAASTRRANAPRARSTRGVQTPGSRARRSSHTSTVLDAQEEHEERRRVVETQESRWYDGIARFWKRNVSVSIGEGQHRDHLALERTFLGYLRTSLALAMSGVLIAQLFRLQHVSSPNPNIGYFVLGVPLAASFIVFGMVLLLIGAYRFWRQQSALARGKIHAGGWELTVIMVLSILVSALLSFVHARSDDLELCMATFVLLVWVDVDKSYG